MIGRLFGKKEGSASQAKERLRIVIDKQRMSRTIGDDLVRDLHKAIFNVIKQHYLVEENDLDVNVKTEGPDSSEMELNIDIHGIREKNSKKT